MWEGTSKLEFLECLLCESIFFSLPLEQTGQFIKKGFIGQDVPEVKLSKGTELTSDEGFHAES